MSMATSTSIRPTPWAIPPSPYLGRFLSVDFQKFLWIGRWAPKRRDRWLRRRLLRKVSSEFRLFRFRHGSPVPPRRGGRSEIIEWQDRTKILRSANSFHGSIRAKTRDSYVWSLTPARLAF